MNFAFIGQIIKIKIEWLCHFMIVVRGKRDKVGLTVRPTLIRNPLLNVFATSPGSPLLGNISNKSGIFASKNVLPCNTVCNLITLPTSSCSAKLNLYKVNLILLLLYTLILRIFEDNM